MNEKMKGRKSEWMNEWKKRWIKRKKKRELLNQLNE